MYIAPMTAAHVLPWDTSASLGRLRHPPSSHRRGPRASATISALAAGGRREALQSGAAQWVVSQYD